MKRLTATTIVLLMVALLLPAAASASEPKAAWEDFKATLGKASELVNTNAAGAAAQVDKAKNVYDTEIEPVMNANETMRQRVISSLVAAKAAAGQGDETALTVNIEKSEKASLALFLNSFESKLASGDIEAAKARFDILATQFKWTDDNEVVQEMNAIVEDPELAKTEGPEVLDGLVAKIVDKVGEEVDEALVAADTKNPDRDTAEARVKAAEGIAYFWAGEVQIAKKLGFEDAARITGLLALVEAGIVNGDLAAAEKAGQVAKDELAEMETTKKISGSALVQAIGHIKANLTTAAKEAQAGKADSAKDLVDEAWTGFTKIESQVRGLDAVSYVRIEKLFGQIKEEPTDGSITELSDLFTNVAAVKTGEAKATRASTTDLIFTNFERVQPILYSILALLGLYPIYLISRAFGWRHRAWRNIGIFIILLTLPVFMEALGRLGVEMKIEVLQALSFTVSEWAKMAWTLIVLAAFLFAISGLRAFCSQFGIKAFGVKQAPDEDFSIEDATVEVL